MTVVALPRPATARLRPGAAATTLLAAALLLLVVFPGLVTGRGPLDADPLAALQAPGGAHLFGTDQLGRDVLSRVLHGARYSLAIGGLSTAIGVLAGVALGLGAGLSPRLADELIARVVDVLSAFPPLLLCLVLIAFTGTGEANLIVALGAASVPRYARLVRAETLVVRRSGFVEQAITFGLPRRLLVGRHVLPHVLQALPVLATLGFGRSILAASALSYLGLGIDPPSPEWGAMLSDGQHHLHTGWWISFFPGVALVTTVLLLTATGRALQRRWDHRERIA